MVDARPSELLSQPPFTAMMRRTRTMKGQISGGAAAAVLVAGLAVAGCPGKTGTTGSSVSISSYDQLNRDLATRVATLLGASSSIDFQIRPTPVDDPIGTVYRKAQSFAVNDTACQPSTQPPARSMPNAFPSYQLDGKIAADVGLNEAVLQGVASAGASVSSGSTVSFSVLDPQLRALTDAAIQDLLRNSNCAPVAKAGLLVVRGYVRGQRTFSTKAEIGGGVKGKILNVGTMDVDGRRNNVVTITDHEPQEFLQIVSEVVLSDSPAGTTSGVQTPQPVQGRGEIYVQQDRSDANTHGSEVRSLLQDAGFDVNPHIERTASSRTPDTPQVRYFNANDKDRATTVLDKLKQQYPEAVLMPMKIQAPPGQLEVWLPRNGARVAK